MILLLLVSLSLFAGSLWLMAEPLDEETPYVRPDDEDEADIPFGPVKRGIDL